MIDIQFFGANTVRLSTKKASIIVDDNLISLGKKAVTKNDEIALFTGPHGESAPNINEKIIIDKPGEYEVSDISIQGIPVRSHLDEEGASNATIFKIVEDDIKIVVLGHIYPVLSEDQLEALGMVDVLIIPVGGNGYTLDGVGALKIIRDIEPRIVIPTHYEQKGITYPVPQQALSDALKALTMEPKEKLSKFRVKPTDLSDSTQLIVLEA